MMNGMNMNKMMKQVKDMQKQMGSEQEKISKQEFTGKSPEELVTVVLNGDHKMKDIKIDPKAIDPEDPDMLSDLVVSAVNNANESIDKQTKDSLGKYTKGIPGM